MKAHFIKAINLFTDKILTPIRMLLVVFYLVEVATNVAAKCLRYLSNEYKKSRLKQCGQGVRLHGKIVITRPDRLILGNNVHINDGAFLKCSGGLTILDNCHISRNLLVYTINHNYTGDYIPYDQTNIEKPVLISENVWIGMNVIVTPGVTIGEGAIIGMGAVVTADVEPMAIVGGNPARTLKFRDNNHYTELKDAKKFSGMSGFPL